MEVLMILPVLAIVMALVVFVGAISAIPGP